VTVEWAKPLIIGAEKSITAPAGKYTVLNNIIYYVGNDERYLVYNPKKKHSFGRYAGFATQTCYGLAYAYAHKGRS
jgi:hypothetical protein